MGCPIRGVILDPIVAMQMGIQGQVPFFFYAKFNLLPVICIIKYIFIFQAGTQFWDDKVASDLSEGRLDGTAFDRWVHIIVERIYVELCSFAEPTN